MLHHIGIEPQGFLGLSDRTESPTLSEALSKGLFKLLFINLLFTVIGTPHRNEAQALPLPEIGDLSASDFHKKFLRCLVKVPE
jgi:hypothetical protein